MQTISDGTIVAQASAQGNARRGIVRLSGDDALRAVAPIFFKRERGEEFPPSSLADVHVAPEAIVPDLNKTAIVLGWFAPWGRDDLDRLVPGALFYWPQGRGFTGERAVELHLPGAAPILDAVVRSVCATKYARLANRGEFTLRAFLSGRLDLTQAEATLGTIDAESDTELQNALNQLSGSLSREFTALRENLFDLLCDLEAGFDFVDEDIEFVTDNIVRDRLLDTRDKIDATLKRAKAQIGADRVPRVALVGSPNVGKSSLFNKLTALFGETSGAAIVSNEAGTTRDYLEQELCVDGVRFLLVDSAGVENLGVDEGAALTPRELAQRGLKELFATAAIVLRCREANARDSEEEEKAIDAIVPENAVVIQVATKVDDPQTATDADVATSAAAERGLEELGKLVADTLKSKTENGEIVPSTAIRCQEALREADEALDNALHIMDDRLRDDFLLASEIRVALNRIGIVTGQVHTDDLLDRIFSRFCIGK